MILEIAFNVIVLVHNVKTQVIVQYAINLLEIYLYVCALKDNMMWMDLLAKLVILSAELVSLQLMNV